MTGSFCSVFIHCIVCYSQDTMLPKRHRLTRERDFSSVHKKGEYVSGTILTLKVAASDQDITRFGFLVGKKVSKKAVVRFKVKRRLREIVRAKLPYLVSGYDVIVMARPGIHLKSFSELKTELDVLLQKARLVQEHR